MTDGIEIVGMSCFLYGTYGKPPNIDPLIVQVVVVIEIMLDFARSPTGTNGRNMKASRQSKLSWNPGFVSTCISGDRKR